MVVADGDLPVGLRVHAAACLAVTFGSVLEGIVGEDATDNSGMIQAGLIPTGIAILWADAEAVKEIRTRAEGIGGVFVEDFTDAAQRPKDYPEYLENVSKMPSEELGYYGAGFYGDKRAINKLTGSLPLLSEVRPLAAEQARDDRRDVPIEGLCLPIGEIISVDQLRKSGDLTVVLSMPTKKIERPPDGPPSVADKVLGFALPIPDARRLRTLPYRGGLSEPVALRS